MQLRTDVKFVGFYTQFRHEWCQNSLYVMKCSIQKCDFATKLTSTGLKYFFFCSTRLVQTDNQALCGTNRTSHNNPTLNASFPSINYLYVFLRKYFNPLNNASTIRITCLNTQKPCFLPTHTAFMCTYDCHNKERLFT